MENPVLDQLVIDAVKLSGILLPLIIAAGTLIHFKNYLNQPIIFAGITAATLIFSTIILAAMMHLSRIIEKGIKREN